MERVSKKILAISGSLRADSYSTKVLQLLRNHISKEIEFVLTDRLDKLPYFNPDIDDDHAFQEVEMFRAQIKSADLVIICTPEYAKGVPGVLKNALDWIVSSGEFIDKPTGVITVSPLPTGGQEAMRSILLTLGMINAHIPKEATWSVPQVSLKINEKGTIMDESFEQELEKFLLHLLVDKKTFP
ncbi:NADPH-dependent FMN reductase [Shimazuella alba]|uniref:Flavoprotein n=1 Tax=Shimazuella alba TaxID=2690964 RepID=A0A6I4VRZ5_9BACL|nr:NADPH-dependent FMN reductase [Shimazuella alba]MXQ54347.1 flavoprotein [Shimazuella alba]